MGISGRPMTSLGRPVATYAADTWAPPAQLPVAVAESAARCADARVTRPSVSCPSSALIRAGPCPPSRARMHVCTMQSFPYVSLLLADGHGSLSSFCIPPAFIVGTSSQLAILTGLPLQLVLCEACCFPLASVDGGIVQVPAPWIPHGYVRQAGFGHLMAWPGRMGRCLRE